MYTEEEQLRDERKLIDLLLKYPKGLALADLTAELSVERPVQVVMSSAFSKSLIRREDGLYFVSVLGAACENTAAQIKSRVDLFNARYQRMPKTNKIKEAERLERVATEAQKVSPPEPVEHVQRPAAVGMGSAPNGTMRANSLRGILAALLFEHRDRYLSVDEILIHVPSLDQDAVRRALWSLTSPKQAGTQNTAYLSRTDHGENALYKWSGNFSSPFANCDNKHVGTSGPGPTLLSSVYKEQLHLLVELESIRATALTAMCELSTAVDRATSALSALTDRSVFIRKLIDSQTPV